MELALFGGTIGSLDRQGTLLCGLARKHAGYAAAALAHPRARALVFHGFRPLILNAASVARLPAAAAAAALGPAATALVLGTEADGDGAGAPLLALDATRAAPDAAAAAAALAPLTAPGSLASFVELRELLMAPAAPALRAPTRDAVDALFALPPAALPWAVPFADAGVLALARSLLVWGAKAAFCGRCGSPTTGVEGGVKRVCAGGGGGGAGGGGDAASAAAAAPCGERLYPRTDPVAIALVLSADRRRALLGRGASFPPGVFSCLAGFLEPGEALEEAVAREVAEEVGVLVQPRDVRYVGSQPWPVGRGATMFGQVMLGAAVQLRPRGEGEADDPPIVLDRDELADACWVPKAEVAEALRAHYGGPSGDGALRVPGPWALAHGLLRRWVRGELPDDGFFARS